MGIVTGLRTRFAFALSEHVSKFSAAAWLAEQTQFQSSDAIIQALKGEKMKASNILYLPFKRAAVRGLG